MKEDITNLYHVIEDGGPINLQYLYKEWKENKTLSRLEMQATAEIIRMAVAARSQCKCFVSPCQKHGSEAICLYCEQTYGWWCPNSPTSFCIYKSYPVEDNESVREIEIFQTLLLVPKTDLIEGYDPECEGDNCIFCGESRHRSPF
jgi:hypothetical protein